jgi:ubiquinone/menaquinone biosynthesis C-methylase UbiE
MTTDTDPIAAGYDAVYATLPSSPTLQRLWREHACGIDFPAEFYHISFVTLSELQRMANELRVRAGNTFVDLGCGLGGPALLVAKETGARLIGIDLSPVAAATATKRAADLGIDAEFRAASFLDTGLPDGSVDAAMSEDALQYAPDKLAAMREAARILRPGGRFVFSAFELHAERVRGLPVLGVDPCEDYRPALESAGFAIEAYEEAPGWPEPVTSAYRAVLDAREALVPEIGEAAMNALAGEMTFTLEARPYRRRVLVVATKR